MLMEKAHMQMLLAEHTHIKLTTEEFDFSPLLALGELGIVDCKTPEELLALKFTGEILIVGILPLSRETLSQLPTVKLILKLGTGVDKIDLPAARELGIAVANLSGYAAEPVGQATLAYILALAMSLPQYAREVETNRWREARFLHPMTLISGKTLGIIGLGGISRYVIKHASSLGMQPIVWTRHSDPALDVEYVSVDRLARESDFLSVHCSLDATTRGLIDAAFLAKAKRSLYLINTARAAVFDEQAVVDALKEHRIAGVAMDVFWQEPPTPGHPLLSMPNVILSPHMTWSPRETRQWLLNDAAEVIADFLAGKPRNIVNAL